MYRQEEPRSEIFVAQVVSESIWPENGAVGGVERPDPPQDDVPGAVVYLSESAGQVVLVVLVVVVGAALDVVVVAAPVVVVVVAPLQGLCAQETAPSDVPPCLEQLSAVNCPHVGGFPGMQQAILFVGFAWAVAFKGTNTTTSS